MMNCEFVKIDIYQRVEKLLLDKVAAGGPNELKAVQNH